MSTQYISIASLADFTFTGSDVNDLANSKTELEVYNSSNSTYASQSITLSNLVSALYDVSLKNLLNAKYGLDPDKASLQPAADYANALSAILSVGSNSLTLQDGASFYHGTVDNAFIDKNALNNTLSAEKNYVSLYDGATYVTKYINLENVEPNLDINSIRQAPATDSDKHNRYIFKVARHTSNVYECEKSGWFTCYGWLSEKETYYPRTAGNGGTGRQDNSKRWAALEGQFNISDVDDSEKWKILQVQPVYPGNDCNYVSFSLPVRKDLKLRVVTGFDVGTNSGGFSNVPGSLANHIPNAFIGGIYV